MQHEYELKCDLSPSLNKSNSSLNNAIDQIKTKNQNSVLSLEQFLNALNKYELNQNYNLDSNILEIKKTKSPLVVKKFSIYLDRLDYAYKPFDSVTGKIHIIIESGVLKLRHLKAYFKGISSVRFTEREYRSNSQSDKHFQDVEYRSDHFIVEIKYCPNLDLNLKKLESGKHQIPFIFKIMNRYIPSSFESVYGYIRYWVYAELNQRDKSEKLFTNDAHVEINSDCCIPIEELKKPLNVEKVKVMSCCAFLLRNPNFIQVRANLMHQAQRKGKSVQVNLYIVNRSRKQIIPNVSLKVKNEFRAINKTRIQEKEIIGCLGDQIKAGKTVLQSILLPISFDLPVVYNCPNIIISYRVKVSIAIPNAFDINFNMPILLTEQKLSSILNSG